jgi:hypothetical protein
VSKTPPHSKARFARDHEKAYVINGRGVKGLMQLPLLVILFKQGEDAILLSFGHNKLVMTTRAFQILYILPTF